MIIFVIIIAVVVAILATIFSTRFFGIVSNVLRGLGYGAGIAWNTFRQTVTWENILAALTPVMGLFIFFGIGSLVFHALFFLFAWGIGIYFNAPWAGFFIGILFPIWAILRSIRFGALRIIYGIMSVVLILAVAHLTIGIISPEYKESLDRWTQNKKLEMANSLNKSSLQSEQESGLFAKVKENVTLLNKDNMPTRVIQKGELVRVLNLSGKKADEKSEGMIEVMYQDEFGYYSGKRIGRLPSRILDWDWKETKTADIRNNAPAPAYNQAPAPSPAPAPTRNSETALATNLSGKWMVCIDEDCFEDRIENDRFFSERINLHFKSWSEGIANGEKFQIEFDPSKTFATGNLNGGKPIKIVKLI